MKTELVYIDNQGYCNVYDISTYEQLQEVFSGIISNLGGDFTKILGLKKLSEFISILEYEHNIFISMNKLSKNGYITIKKEM